MPSLTRSRHSGIPLPVQLQCRAAKATVSVIRMVMPSDGRELTDPMKAYARCRVEELSGNELSGYILKKNSPSCGMERVRVYKSKGNPLRDGRGIFAQELMTRLPDLPVEEEGRLHDPDLCENWITRVFAYWRLRLLWRTPWSIAELMQFHARHKDFRVFDAVDVGKQLPGHIQRLSDCLKCLAAFHHVA